MRAAVEHDSAVGAEKVGKAHRLAAVAPVGILPQFSVATTPPVHTRKVASSRLDDVVPVGGSSSHRWGREPMAGRAANGDPPGRR